MILTGTARRSVPTRPALLTPAFVTVTLAALAYFTGDGVLIPAVPRYTHGPLGAGDVAVGLVVAAFSLSAFFLRPWAGRVADRWGRRPLMLTGAGLFAVSTLAYGLASSPAALAGLRLVTGAGEALFFVGALAAVADLAPAERRGEAMSLASLSLYLGIGVGPLLGELAIDRLGFPAAWALAAGCGLVAVTLALRVPDTRPDDAEAGGPPARHRLVHPAGLLPGLLLLAGITGMAGFLTFVPLYALDLGLDGSRGVLLLFAAIVVGIRGFGARLPDRLGAARATRAAMALTAAGLAVAGAWRTPAGLVAGTAVFAVGVALLTPAVLTLAVEAVGPRERGAVLGTTSSFLDLALGLGPATLGLVAASTGRPGAFLGGAAVAAAGLLLAWAGPGRLRAGR
ncbi:MAG TPA: MFS transporter [Actinomycetota bacterium]|jgi:MFS family permease|nr:MFS transporter [Actinomycetota bacterium]